jgi:hypothetical protein
MIRNIFKKVYDSVVRPYTPKKISMCNGVAVKRVHLFDYTETFPEYKREFVTPLAETIQDGDTVVQVGAGAGVSTVVAAEIAGPNGKAITFEASEDQLNAANETLRLNKKTWRNWADVDIHHALIGTAVKVPGELGEPKLIDPEDLPECDIMGLDCEGAETDILQEMSNSPSRVVVESHGWLGSSTSDIKQILENRGYQIIDEIPQRPARDNFVLVGSQEV